MENDPFMKRRWCPWICVQSQFSGIEIQAAFNLWNIYFHLLQSTRMVNVLECDGDKRTNEVYFFKYRQTFNKYFLTVLFCLNTIYHRGSHSECCLVKVLLQLCPLSTTKRIDGKTTVGADRINSLVHSFATRWTCTASRHRWYDSSRVCSPLGWVYSFSWDIFTFIFSWKNFF